MALSRNQMVVSFAFLIITIGTVVALFYHAATVDMDVRQAENQRRADAAQPVRRATVLGDRVILLKDEALSLGRARVVYRGSADGRIRLDVTLLDLDPAYAYPRSITTDEARKGILIGTVRYRLQAVSSRSLTLRLAD